MMQIVSEEESRRWNAEMDLLYRSASLEDRAVAIMMDLKIGGSGYSGDKAREKVKAILALLQKDGQASTKISVELAEEVRRTVMADITEGCGKCHWANDYIIDRVKELDKMRSKGTGS